MNDVPGANAYGLTLTKPNEAHHATSSPPTLTALRKLIIGYGKDCRLAGLRHENIDCIVSDADSVGHRCSKVYMMWRSWVRSPPRGAREGFMGSSVGRAPQRPLALRCVRRIRPGYCFLRSGLSPANAGWFTLVKSERTSGFEAHRLGGNPRSGLAETLAHVTIQLSSPGALSNFPHPPPDFCR